MGKYKADAMGWDFNGPIMKGYPEITAAYRMMFRALNNFNLIRFKKLCFDAQPKCWKLTSGGKLDELAYVMTKDVFHGEDYGFLQDYFARHDIAKTLTNKSLRKLPKVGKKIDSRVNEDAIHVIEELHLDDVNQFVYSASFWDIIWGVLQRNGITNMGPVYANKLGKYKIGGKLVDYANDEEGNPIEGAFLVDPTDKSRNFRKALVEMGLDINGNKIAYIDDSPQGKNIFGMVEFPIVDPSAKDEFKDECRDDPDLSDRIFVPEDRVQILDHLSDEPKKLYSIPE